MARRRKAKYFTMTVHRHGIIWWLLIGWWWRPTLYFLWAFICGMTSHGLKKRIDD